MQYAEEIGVDSTGAARIEALGLDIVFSRERTADAAGTEMLARTAARLEGGSGLGFRVSYFITTLNPKPLGLTGLGFIRFRVFIHEASGWTYPKP